VIQDARDTAFGDSLGYDANSFDFYNAEMRGLPSAGSLAKFSWCVEPGEFILHAVDTAGDGWWGQAYYSVLVDGVTVVREEMNQTSSTNQSAPFTVALPTSARTEFTDNKAMQGGGGAIFWADVSPENVERYRNESTSNTALYGDYVATPARELTVAKHSFDTVSGSSMSADPITVELRDRY
jgi:hypothetical protein